MTPPATNLQFCLIFTFPLHHRRDDDGGGVAVSLLRPDGGRRRDGRRRREVGNHVAEIHHRAAREVCINSCQDRNQPGVSSMKKYR